MFLPPVPPALQSPAPEPEARIAVALDLSAGEGTPPAFAAELKALLLKAGIAVRPADAPDVKVLRVLTAVSEQKGLCWVTLRYLYGTRDELKPRQDAEGRPDGPWPTAALKTVLRDPQMASQVLKEGAGSVLRRVLQDLPPLPAPKATAAVTGGVAGGVVGGIVGGTGRGMADGYEPMKVRFQPPVPGYPPIAKIAKVQGVVKVELTVDPEGVPTEVRLLEGPPLLVETVMNYAMAWRFDPEIAHGQKTWCRFRLSMPFNLH